MSHTDRSHRSLVWLLHGVLLVIGLHFAVQGAVSSWGSGSQNPTRLTESVIAARSELRNFGHRLVMMLEELALLERHQRHWEVSLRPQLSALPPEGPPAAQAQRILSHRQSIAPDAIDLIRHHATELHEFVQSELLQANPQPPSASTIDALEGRATRIASALAWHKSAATELDALLREANRPPAKPVTPTSKLTTDPVDVALSQWDAHSYPLIKLRSYAFNQMAVIYGDNPRFADPAQRLRLFLWLFAEQVSIDWYEERVEAGLFKPFDFAPYDPHQHPRQAGLVARALLERALPLYLVDKQRVASGRRPVIFVDTTRYLLGDWERARTGFGRYDLGPAPSAQDAAHLPSILTMTGNEVVPLDP